MDNQTLFVAAFAAIAMLIFGSFYLNPAPSSADGVTTADASAQHTYAPDDIRYKFQQEEAKKRLKEKKEHPNAAKMPKTSGSSGSGGSDGDSSDDSSDGSSLSDHPALSDHEPQEEPELN